jgi:Caspase domain
MPLLTRRSVLGSVAASAALALTAVRALAQAADRGRLHALIIGINAYSGRTGIRSPATGLMSYQPIRRLNGCVNDARAIEAAVTPLTATKPRVLLNEYVTRASFLSAWQDMVDDSAEGDTLLVTYSGHGSQEPARGGTQPTGRMHNTFILSSFDTSQPPLNQERIFDDEIQGLWQSVARRNKVVFVADSCHAGGMTRSADLRVEAGITYRFVPGGYEIEGETPGRIQIPTSPSGLEVPHVIFLAGAQHNELVPEIKIRDRYHGALSLSFAQALSGRADVDRDGIVTGAELGSYVLRSIRTISDSIQHVNVRWPNADVRSGSGMRPEDPLFFVPRSAGPIGQLGPAGSVALRILGLASDAKDKVAQTLKGATIVDSPEQADLTWDAGSHDVLDRIGKIASGVTAQGLQAVIDRTNAIAAVRQMVVNSGFDMRLLLPGESPSAAPSIASDRPHARGTRLKLVASGLRNPFFVLFNIAGDGTVQFLYPRRDKNDSLTVPTGKAWFFDDIDVQPPYGADHAIGVAAGQALPSLVATLERLHMKKDPAAAVEELGRHALGADVQVGMQGVFTTEK